ncbi:ATP-dependent helicase [Colwelliaceae bacterium BS250]
MSLDNLLTELNEKQKKAATLPHTHALVLAGAGTGKTKTIIARAAYLISQGVLPQKIQILTFTRKSASEIVSRVKSHIGDKAQGLRASTFHTWCMSLIRKAPRIFGGKGYSVIDKDDQLQLFKILRGRVKKGELATARELCDLYSLCRNTLKPLKQVLISELPQYESSFENIKKIMLAYESKKSELNYLDYDDILDLVAQHININEQARAWVAKQFEHLLIDEMQDTNPLQWKLVNPLKKDITLFCVGDDAQSIYGFRGADFKNIHSFKEKVPDATILKLEDNYRSTQEILNVSNWLLDESTLQYGKKLHAVKGHGAKPKLVSFENEWEEAKWIGDDLIKKRKQGNKWKEHMILVRSSRAGRAVESMMLEREIPYVYIGGTKLLDSAHIRDLLSLIRIAGNLLDEIAWMRFLTLWRGVGEVTAAKVVMDIFQLKGELEIFELLKAHKKIPPEVADTFKAVIDKKTNVADALQSAFNNMKVLLASKYEKQNWENRKNDITAVKRLAEKHNSILGFIENYLLDPIHISQVNRAVVKDTVTIITIHSAKGTECKICYVINVSPGAYPNSYMANNEDEVEEERRVLYVALTRAVDELIITRQSRAMWAERGDDDAETYFFNSIPEDLFEVIEMDDEQVTYIDASRGAGGRRISIGIQIDDEGNFNKEPTSVFNQEMEDREMFWLNEL